MVLRIKFKDEELRHLDFKNGLKRALYSILFWIILMGIASLLPKPGEPFEFAPPTFEDLLVPEMIIYAFLAFVSGLLHRTLLAPALSICTGFYLAYQMIQIPGEISVNIPQGKVQVNMSPLIEILIAWILLDSLLWAIEPISQNKLKQRRKRLV